MSTRCPSTPPGAADRRTSPGLPQGTADTVTVLRASPSSWPCACSSRGSRLRSAYFIERSLRRRAVVESEPSIRTLTFSTTSKTNLLTFSGGVGRQLFHYLKLRVVSLPSASVTRLGNFGGLFKVCGNNLPTFKGNFWKGVKIFHFSSEIIFGQLLLQTLGDFFLVTLHSCPLSSFVSSLPSRH